MTNNEIMREAVLDEFIEELKSNRLNESTGFTSIELRVMEAYDFTPFDVIESDKLANRFPEDIAPLHEGFGSFIGGLLMKPAVAGAGLNIAIATIIAVAEKFLPAGDGILGKIGSFFRNQTGVASLAKGAAATIPGILAAAYKVSQDPDYQQAKTRHNKAVCRRMMKKAVIAAGLTGLVANVVAAYLISPKATAQLVQAGNEAKAEIGQTGTTPTVDQVAKEVATDSKLDATETKKVAALAVSNGATADTATASQIAQTNDAVNQKIQGDIPNLAASENGTTALESGTATPDATSSIISETPTEQVSGSAQFATESKPIASGIDIDPKTNKLVGLTRNEQIGANKVNALVSEYGVEKFKSPNELLKILKDKGASEEELLGAKKQIYANAAIALHDGKSDINDDFYAGAHKSYVSELSKGRDELLTAAQKLDRTRDKSYDQLFGRLASDGQLTNQDKINAQNMAVSAFDKQYGYSAICKDTEDKQQQYDIANKSYTDALNTYNKAKLDGISGRGLGEYRKVLSAAGSNLENAKLALSAAQQKEQEFQAMRTEVDNRVGRAFDSYKSQAGLAANISNNQSYLSSLGVGSKSDANLEHANSVAAKNGIESPFAPAQPVSQPDAHKTYNQAAALAANNTTQEQPKPAPVATAPRIPRAQRKSMVNSVSDLLSNNSGTTN